MLEHDSRTNHMDRFFDFPQEQNDDARENDLIASILKDCGDAPLFTGGTGDLLPVQASQALSGLPSVFPSGEVIGDSSLNLPLALHEPPQVFTAPLHGPISASPCQNAWQLPAVRIWIK